MRKDGTGYCLDTTAQEMNPFPMTLPGCGAIGMSARTFVPAPWVWSCAVREAGLETPQVSGNTATFVANGTLWYTGFTATLTVTASLDESYQVAQVNAKPQDSTLTCNGATAVDVTILDGHGNLYVPCGGTQLMGTASINAKGAYAFLEGNGQSGQTIDFAVNNGRGGFLVVLDTSKGIIPKGFDATTITATVNGVNGQATIAMSCPYPPPTVQITNPLADTTILVSSTNQPIITLSEEHTPTEGQFVPSITWDPSPTINTADYYDQIQDSLVIPVKVTAENDGGTATDTITVTLKKQACDDAPECTEPAEPPTIVLRELKRGDFPSDPCPQPRPSEKKYPLGGFRPVSLEEGPIGDINLVACFDRDSDRWNFNAPTVDIRVFLDLCPQNAPPGVIIVDGVSEIVLAEPCKAVKDLRAHQTYPIAPKETGYVLKPILEIHERLHKRVYQEFIDKGKAAFDRAFREYSPRCTEFTSLGHAVEDGKKHIRSLLLQLWGKASTEYESQFVGMTEEDKTVYERERIHSQPEVQNLIQDLIFQFLQLHPECK